MATAIILNSIPLATNPNGTLLLTWLLETSGFPARFKLLAPRFTPHLSHLCTHKLASLTVLRIVNQKIEPEASTSIVKTLFVSSGDHVLADVLGDQVNGVAVVHKILGSPYIEPPEKALYMEATKRVLVEIKASPTQAYRRLMEEVGIPIPMMPQPSYPMTMNSGTSSRTHSATNTPYGAPLGLHTGGGYMGEKEPSGLTPIMGNIALAGNGNHHHQGMPSPMQGYQVLGGQPGYASSPIQRAPGQGGGRSIASPPIFSPNSDPFNPFPVHSPEMGINARSLNMNGGGMRRIPGGSGPSTPQMQTLQYSGAPMGVQQYGMTAHPQYQQAYVYQMYPTQGGNFVQ